MTKPDTSTEAVAELVKATETEAAFYDRPGGALVGIVSTKALTTHQVLSVNAATLESLAAERDELKQEVTSLEAVIRHDEDRITELGAEVERLEEESAQDLKDLYESMSR